MTTPTEIRKKAIELVEKLPKEMLIEAVELLESLRVKAERLRNLDLQKPEESALLEIIDRRLSPQDRLRLDYLREQNEWGELTEAEYNELLAYVEQVESQDTLRVAALIELAKIRKVNLATLSGEFTSEESISNV